MIWPTVEEVQTQLETVRKMATDDTDVRLQVHENGAWYIRIGDPSYDTDHRGFWGAAIVSPADSNADLKIAAGYLLDEVKEQHALR
jgi:hypothetical protein